jgi:hypothetical protein
MLTFWIVSVVIVEILDFEGVEAATDVKVAKP